MISRGSRDIFVTQDELRRRARSGLLAPSDLVFHPRLGRWLYAHEVAEVAEELRRARQLGRAAPPENTVVVPVNGSAVAGLVLGLMGYIPFVGLVLSGLGLYLSGRGLMVAQQHLGSGHRLSVAGLIVSLAFFLPQLCAAALLLSL